MTQSPPPAPIFIARSAALERLARLLRQESILAVDTESNSLYAYQEQVCLIQFSTREYDYLVDPLALMDLSCLGPVFSSPEIEKVFHAAEYDVICLRRDFGFEFANIFDTMVAARILGREEVGLGAILEREYGLQVDKRFQRANWGRRPIPPDLLAYAQLDTHYLIPLREGMQAELEKRDLWPLACEDFQRLTLANGKGGENRGPDCWRITGARDLTPKQSAVLQELCRYRHKMARNANRPLFKVIGDHSLLAIAQHCPRTLDELARLQGMTPGQVARYGEELLASVRRGLQAAPIYPPHNNRPDEKYLNRLDALKEWRKRTALHMGVPSDVVLPKDLMLELADANPTDRKELSAVMYSAPWRLEKFGEKILETLRH
jgi:ribonuclease D